MDRKSASVSRALHAKITRNVIESHKNISDI